MINSNPNIFYAVKLIADHVREFSKKTPLDENFISKSINLNLKFFLFADLFFNCVL